MNIDEAKREKAIFEARLRNVAAECVDEFQRRTKLKVVNVYVEVLDVTQIGESPRSVVESVQFRIDF